MTRHDRFRAEYTVCEGKSTPYLSEMTESVGVVFSSTREILCGNVIYILKGYLMVEMSTCFMWFPKAKPETMRVKEVYFSPTPKIVFH